MAVTGRWKPRAFVTVVLGRLLLPLLLGALLTIDLQLRWDAERTGLATVCGLVFAVVVGGAMTNAFPPRQRGCRLIALRRRHTDGAARNGPPRRRAGGVAQKRLEEIVDAGADSSERDVRRRAYVGLIDLAHEHGRKEHSMRRARAFLDEFGVGEAMATTTGRRIPPMFAGVHRVLVRVLRERWDAGDRSEDLVRALLENVGDDERIPLLRAAIEAGGPFRRDLMHAVMATVPLAFGGRGPHYDIFAWRAKLPEAEQIARAGLATEPRLIEELVINLIGQGRLEDALAVAREEEAKGNEYAARKVAEAERTLNRPPAWQTWMATPPGRRSTLDHPGGGD